MEDPVQSDFEKASAAHREEGIVSDFWHFVTASKKWWLIPILFFLLVFGLLLLMSGSAVAPFIYSLF